MQYKTRKNTAPTLFCAVFVVVVDGAALDTTITVMHLLLLLYNPHVIIIFFPVYFFIVRTALMVFILQKAISICLMRFQNIDFHQLYAFFVCSCYFFFVRLANGKLPCSWQFVMMMIWWWRTWSEANEDMNSRKWIECVQNNKIQTNRKKSSGMNIK